MPRFLFLNGIDAKHGSKSMRPLSPEERQTLEKLEQRWDELTSAEARQQFEKEVFKAQPPEVAGEFQRFITFRQRELVRSYIHEAQGSTDPVTKLGDFRRQILNDYGGKALEILDAEAQKHELFGGSTRYSTGMATPSLHTLRLWELRATEGVVYGLQDQLGAGGMGQVWKAKRKDNQNSTQWPRIIALKLASGGSEDIHALEHEGGLLSGLDSPYVVRRLGMGILHYAAPVVNSAADSGPVPILESDSPEVHGVPCLLLGFTPGAVSLAEALKENRDLWKNDFRLSVRLLIHLAKGLQYLHETESLAHGDIKPQNLLVHLESLKALEHGGEPEAQPLQLIDFGISSPILRLKGSSAQTRLGTAAYAAPESRSGQVLLESDVFPLGLIMVELFSGLQINELHKWLPRLGSGLSGPNEKSSLTVDRVFTLILQQHEGADWYRVWNQRSLMEPLLAGILAENPKQRAGASSVILSLTTLERSFSHSYWPSSRAVRLGNPYAVTYFTEVPGVREGIEAAFSVPQRQFPLVHILKGFGGVGKTTQASRFCFTASDEKYPFRLWTNATNAQVLRHDLQTALWELHPDRKDPARDQDPIQYFKNLFASRPGWLWVLNNYPDEAYGQTQEGAEPEYKGITSWIRDFLPYAGQGHILITTRLAASEFAPHFRFGAHSGTVSTQEIEVMRGDLALEFLLRRAGWEPPNSSPAWHRKSKVAPNTIAVRELNDDEREAAGELVGPKNLDGLPLAIELAGELMNADQQTSFRDYLRSYQKDSLKLLDQAYKTNTHLPMGVLKVTATYLALIQHIQKDHPQAVDLLRLSAVVDVDRIPIELLMREVDWPSVTLNELLKSTQNDPRDRERDMQRHLKVLTDHSLARMEFENRTWSIHKVLRDVVNRLMSKAEHEAWRKSVSLAAFEFFTHFDKSNWISASAASLIVPIAMRYSDDWGKLPLEILPWQLFSALTGMGDVFMAQGEPEQAATLFSKSLEMSRTYVQGDLDNPDDPDYPTDLSIALDRIGGVFMAQGKPEQAAPLFDEGLERSRAFLLKDPDDPGRQRGLNIALQRMGDVFMAQRKPEQAAPLFGQSLERSRAILLRDPDNPDRQRDLTVSLVKMGDVFLAQGKPEQAAPLFDESLAMSRAILLRDPDNPDRQSDVVIGLLSLAEMYGPLQKDKATACFQEAKDLVLDLVKRFPGNATSQALLEVLRQLHRHLFGEPPGF